ncbi:phage tail tape measure protein [Ochrobactrum sp. S1502_03]|uniref:phage tail tape measure protein n=1 Tax=Ochrobactrum sp. S1502_03 TaxID=3108451 RepID=UPI0037C725C8
MSVIESKLIVSLFDRVSGPARGLFGTMNRLRGAADNFAASQRKLASPITGTLGRIAAFGAAYISLDRGIRSTAGAAIEFESAFADVKKVVEATDSQFLNMRKSILRLSTAIPITASGFAAIYAAAGQSGIANEELESFAEATAKVATAWETPVGETGEALAKIKTALGRNVTDTVLLADAINEVGNTSAANAPSLLEYTNRVAAFAETAGFSAEQALAFGGAMIGSGFEPEVAATSFRNLTKALTTGENATKRQRTAFKQLGLDSVKVAKGMQKDAVKTTLSVLNRIKKLPQWQQISVMEAVFGSEARALAPLLKSTEELERLLAMVANKTNYAGSSFKEYETRAKTTANALQLLRNNLAAIGIEMGDRMLPAINDGAAGILDLLKSLGDRATPLDQLWQAIKGFSSGLGYDGNLRQMINDLGDLLLGPANGEEAADKLGRIFARFKEFGASLRAFNDAVKNSPLAHFLGEVLKYGGYLMLASVGLGILAGTVRKLASALYFLSGARAAVGILRSVVSLGRSITGGSAAAGAVGTASGAAAANIGRGGAAVGGGWLTRLLYGGVEVGAVKTGAASSQTGLFAKIVGSGLGSFLSRANIWSTVGYAIYKGLEAKGPSDPKLIDQEYFIQKMNEYNLKQGNSTGQREVAPAPKQAAPSETVPFSFRQLWNDLIAPSPTYSEPEKVTLLGSPTVVTEPSGVQQVQVMNPPPAPNVNLSLVINAKSAATPEEIANLAAAKVTQSVRSAFDGIHADLEYGVS